MVWSDTYHSWLLYDSKIKTEEINIEEEILNDSEVCELGENIINIEKMIYIIFYKKYFKI